MRLKITAAEAKDRADRFIKPRREPHALDVLDSIVNAIDKFSKEGDHLMSYNIFPGGLPSEHDDIWNILRENGYILKFRYNSDYDTVTVDWS